ncbi:MAG: nucleotide exchange factor GrpE [Deltaproteobacteria bacterium]
MSAKKSKKSEKRKNGQETVDAELGDATTVADPQSEDAANGGSDGDQPAVSAAEELEAARNEAAENYDRFVRKVAELDNVLKRHTRDLSERARYAVEPMARDLLAVVDDLERALGHADDGQGGLAEGVDLVLKGLLSLLDGHGVKRIETVGERFDPSRHQAVATVETAEVEANSVVEEHRAGYLLHDRLLRPAIVVVSKTPKDGPEEAEG